MGRRKRRRLAPSATPWDWVAPGLLTPAQQLVAASHSKSYGFRHGPLGGDAAFLNSFAREACPRCGDTHIIKYGLDSSGLRRWLCTGCGRTFNPTTGTIFEDRKLSLPDWVEFLLQAFSYESVNAMTREDRRSDTTVPYWMAKLFAVLEGVQDGTVLKGRVWIDETYYPVPRAEEVAVDGVRLRGLSRNKICIAVGCDDYDRSYFRRAGYGRPSAAEVMEAYGAHIDRKAELVHDMEVGHRRLVRELGLKEELHNSKLTVRLPDKDNPMREVNRLCGLLKGFLNSHSGFDRDDLDGYLDLFSVMMNPPAHKMEKAALVLDRAMVTPKTLRFRDFYNLNPC